MNQLNAIFKQIKNKSFDATCIKNSTLVNNELTRLEELLSNLCCIKKYKTVQIKLNTLCTIKEIDYNLNKVSKNIVYERGLKKINKKIAKAQKQLQEYERVKRILLNRIDSVNNSYFIENSSCNKNTQPKIVSCVVKNKDILNEQILEM